MLHKELSSSPSLYLSITANLATIVEAQLRTVFVVFALSKAC